MKVPSNQGDDTMSNAARWVLAVGTILLVAPLLGVQAADGDEMVDNPFFKYWSKHKPGATVTLLEKTVLSGPDKAEVPDGIDEKTVANKLLDVKADGVVVQFVVTEREFLSTVESAPTKKTYPAKVKKSHLQAGLRGVDPKMGEETITVLGEKLPCVTMAGTEKNGTTETEHKIWLSEKVPGGVVKHTRVTKQDGKVVADTTIAVQSYSEGK
jgi:hypothetical protein